MKRLFTMLIIFSVAMTFGFAQVVDDFETDIGNWADPNYSGSTTADASSSITVSTEQAHGGLSSAKVELVDDAGTTGGYFVRMNNRTDVYASDAKIGFWVYTATQDVEFRLVIWDNGTGGDGYEAGPYWTVAAANTWEYFELDLVNDAVTGWITGNSAINSTDVVKIESIQFNTTVDANAIFYIDDLGVAPPLANLFFSEYIEGSSNNKALEIYNPTDAVVDLAGYQIAQSVNGGGWQYYHTFPAGHSIAADDVYVLANSSAVEAILAVGDDTLSYPSAVHHNGDDARALIYAWGNDTLWMDVIGIPTEDPGSAWDVAGTVGGTGEHTLTRKSWVFTGNMDWAMAAGTDAASSEWIVSAQDDFAGIGAHTFSPNNVTLSVDMGWQMTIGTFDAANDFVDVAGSFNGWSASMPFTKGATDSIYTATFPMMEGGIEYKFRINGSWDTAENLSANRAFTVAAGANTIPTVWYSDQEPGPTQDLEVLISVDMTVQLLNNNFNPTDSSDVIVIRGGHDEFGNWGGAVAMTLSTTTANVYEYIASFTNLPVGSGFEYKFVILNGGDTEDAQWEGSPNRTFGSTGSETDTDANGFVELAMPVDYFADVTPADIITQDVTVTFAVNLASAYNAMWAGKTLIDTQTGSDDISLWSEVVGVNINGILSQWWDWGNDVTSTGTWAMTATADEFIYTYDYLFTAGQAKVQNYKYGINSLDNEAGFAQNREMTIDDAAATFVAPVDCFGSQNTDPALPFPMGCVATSVDAPTELPSVYALEQNYPNPFNPTTTINFNLPEASSVKLTIYNALGQEVRTLKSEHFNAGSYSVNWNGLDNAGNTISSGLYIYTLSAGDQNFSKKMLMLK